MGRTPCCDKDSLKKGPWTAEEDEILCNYIKEIGGHGSRRSLPKMRVPIFVVASLKKIKALITSHSQLATVLRNSSKLVVNEDGKKIKHQYPLTESDIEELQSRIVVAENLPEDHCHQNLMKVFCAVGSVKTIRTCPPQTSNSGASSAARLGKVDGMSLSNKLHTFVEYESVELAERAVSTNAFPELAWNYF